MSSPLAFFCAYPHLAFILRSGLLAASRRMEFRLMVRDGARAPPHHEEKEYFARLQRGLSPHCLCYLNVRLETKDIAMPEAATSPLPNDPALLRIEGPIATITLNRPVAFNSVNLAIAQKLEQLAAEVEGNDGVRVLVIEGEGRAFSAGGDLQTIGAAAAADTIAPVVGELLKHYHAFIETVRRMPKIVLSSVHGSAAGAGMGLAFVTDLCIAADDARFTPAYAKIGVSPDGGSTVGMVGTVGVRRAFQIFLAEDTFTAQQAQDWGLVAKVVPAADLKAETKKFAERRGAKGAVGMGGTKALVYQAAVTPTKQQLDAEEANIIACMQTDEFRAAVKKFTSKGK